MDKVLVTGGAGLIGSHLVDLLLQRGYAVRILDNLEPSTHLEGEPSWIPAEVEFLRGDVRNQDDVVKALRGVRVVFHQAAYGGLAPELTKMTDVNATGTARIFEVIRSEGLDVRKVITASSQAVYGEGAYNCVACGPCHPEPRDVAQLEKGEWEVRCPRCGAATRARAVSEDAPANLTSLYALTKYFEERLTLALGRDWGIPTVALRYFLTYGPRQSIYNPYTGIASIFSTRLLNHLPPVLYEDGQQQRDFVFVEDVARANLVALENDAANGRVFNVGTGQGTSVDLFARLLGEAFGVSIEPSVPGEFRPMDVRHLTADPSRLGALGWKAAVPVDEGVRRYAGWIAGLGRPAEYFEAAAQRLKRLRVVRKARQD